LAVPGIAFLLPLSIFSSGLASNGTEATATSIVSSAASVPPACLVRLVARDESDRTLFESVAAATATPGLAVAPLHPLERGGVQWRSLAILRDDAGTGTPPSWGVIAVESLDRDRDQVLLQAPGLPPCAGRDSALAQAVSPAPAGRFDTGPSPGSAPAPGSAVLLARGRDGFRNRLIGGRVERVVQLPGERRMVLVRLLDERGADPGLLFDPVGSLLGSVLPPPAGGDPSLATVVLQPARPASDPAAESPSSDAGASAAAASTAPAAASPRSVREAIAANPSPSVLGPVPGLVSQALRLSGPARYDRALALLDAASRQAGVTASLLLEKGVLEFGAGRVASAVEDFRQAAGIDPASHLARYNLGIALGTEGRYQDAATALQSARDLEPGHGRTHFQLALALRALGKTAEARRELDSLSQIDPVLAGELKVILGT
jgi:TolA-binding protein